MAQTPEEILTGAWQRVHDVEPPVANPPGPEWHFAVGAQWALGTTGLLDDATIRRWETHAQSEAKRLGARPQPPMTPPNAQR